MIRATRYAATETKPDGTRASGYEIAAIEREHDGNDPWVLTALSDPRLPEHVRTSPLAGRYATKAQTDDDARRLLGNVGATLSRWLQANDALGLSARAELSRAATAVGIAQDDLPGILGPAKDEPHPVTCEACLGDVAAQHTHDLGCDEA